MMKKSNELKSLHDIVLAPHKLYCMDFVFVLGFCMGQYGRTTLSTSKSSSKLSLEGHTSIGDNIGDSDLRVANFLMEPGGTWSFPIF